MAPPSHPLKSPTIRGGSDGSPVATKVTSPPRTIGEGAACAAAATTAPTTTTSQASRISGPSYGRSRRRHYHVAVKRLLTVALFLLVTIGPTGAVTRLPSADGQFWDIQDTSTWAQDSGGIATGGRANPFNGFGYLKIQVRTTGGTVLTPNLYVRGFGLAHDGGERFDSITPVFTSGIVVDRGIFAPKDTDYLRYVDSFTNTSTEARAISVAWGGAVGAFDDGGRAAVAVTSNGDRTIEPGDTFVTMMQNARGAAEPERGPSGHGPSAHVLGARTAGLLTRVGDMFADPFTDAWPGYDPAHVGYVFSITVRAGATASIMTFVVKGLSEIYDPRGGFPVSIKDGIVAPKSGAPYSGPAPIIPAAGSQIAVVTETARRLVANPDLRGLTRQQRGAILNWGLPDDPPAPMTIVEKTAPELQDALTRGVTTSEDIVRGYLARLATYDRNGPALRSMLALNPRAIAEARALDAERAAGRVRGPLHGIPVAFKDNIDVLGLPTTGGALALVDHRPRLGSRVAAGMRRAGAVILGKANLDEFPFGDFGISSVGGTIGNAYDPTLSVAGSSGGSATAVTASFVTLAFGTDTCNSLSNPAAFASLATIRTTRGLTSRAGVMPLNTYNDAVGPLAKSVRELALVLDQVAGVDPEDEATQAAAAHIGGSFAAALDARGASLAGRRIGVMRQLFVGVTGEREIATLMDAVVGELMDRERIDVLLYPANQARPHTHEGGLERYGGEPGTCEESAMTGLPQVTVPAGFMGARYPFGISFLGRLWSDRDVLAIAYAYEQATHHRRPPPIAR